MGEAVEAKSVDVKFIKKSTELWEKLPPAPEGMSKNQWKKLCRKERHEKTKTEYNLVKKEKRKAARERRKQLIAKIVESGNEIPAELIRAPRVNNNQKDSGITIIMDCAFDDLMNDKEISSMANQITRSHSSNKKENHFAQIVVSSFNKRLKHRFDNELSNYRYDSWKNFTFLENEDCITGPDVNRSELVYLTADTDEKLETLESGKTYIVGGIVDKNRHKLLCYNKAKELGIPTKRLPIDEFIKLAGRRVLTTTHVIQLMLKYFDKKDWKDAFEKVLPQRKLDNKSKEVEESDQAELSTNEEVSDAADFKAGTDI